MGETNSTSLTTERTPTAKHTAMGEQRVPSAENGAASDRRSPLAAAQGPTDGQTDGRMMKMALLTSITLIALVAGRILAQFDGTSAAPLWLLYGTAYLAGGFYPLQEAWSSLKQRSFDINVLMIVAALGAAAVGEPFEGAILMFLFSLSGTLETFAMGRTEASIKALLDVSPQVARTIGADGDEAVVPVDDIAVGWMVRVRPGEKIPVDGVVRRGHSDVDEASITGESVPVEKTDGAKVFAGTMNGSGSLDIETTAAVTESTLARIVAIVQEAREKKARSQDFTDRIIGRYYAYGVVIMTLLAIIIPLAFLGWEVRETVYRAMTLMVVASPCAVVISIPAALLSALAGSARQGVLFKGGLHVEQAARVRVVAFDKTGTLTTGQPRVAAVFVDERRLPAALLNGREPAGKNGGQTDEMNEADDAGTTVDGNGSGNLGAAQLALLRTAAAVEQFSEHPLATAIVQFHRRIGGKEETATRFRAQTGVGVSAVVAGIAVTVGRKSQFAPLDGPLREELLRAEEEGKSVVLVGNGEAWGFICLEDTVRPHAKSVVQTLKRNGIEQVILLTGDNRRVAEKLGRELGIDQVYSELMPEDKVSTVEALRERYQAVAMVGDGVNDAPALAGATVGIAMGVAGSDVAVESADILLMGDEIERIPSALRHARMARRLIRQNLLFAFSVAAILVVFTLLGHVPLPLGVLGHEGSTVIVVLNGLRLLIPPR